MPVVEESVESQRLTVEHPLQVAVPLGPVPLAAVAVSIGLLESHVRAGRESHDLVVVEHVVLQDGVHYGGLLFGVRWEMEILDLNSVSTWPKGGGWLEGEKLIHVRGIQY